MLPQHLSGTKAGELIQYTIGFSLKGFKVCRIESEDLTLLNLGDEEGTYEGEHDEDKESKDGASGAGDGAEHGAGGQEDGEGGQAEGQELGHNSPWGAAHSKKAEVGIRLLKKIETDQPNDVLMGIKPVIWISTRGILEIG